jgi:hypothetical protein
MKKVPALHPFLFVLFYVLFVYHHNAQRLLLWQLWAPLLVILGAALVLFLAFSLVLRDSTRAGLILSLFLVLFFSYGHAYAPIQDSVQWYSRHLVLLILWPVLFTAGGAIVIRAKRRVQELTKILNVMMAVLATFSLFNVTIDVSSNISARSSGAAPIGVDIVQTAPVDTDTLPDIYYIILDGYARADILDELYGYDNTDFLEYLEGRGFFVAENSQSNYVQTALSIASSLNLVYLDALLAHVDSEYRDLTHFGPLRTYIRDNPFLEFLKTQGYAIIALPTAYGLVGLPNADVYVGTSRTLNELEIGLINSTPIVWILAMLAREGEGEYDLHDSHRSKILFALEHLQGEPVPEGPRFVYAHIVAPHPPFVLDDEGNAIAPGRPFTLNDGSHFFEDGGTPDEYITGYTNQLTFVNNSMRTAIDAIVSEATRPVIIILQADHGPGLLLDNEAKDNTYLKERFSILNAYLLPGHGAVSLYDGITPVNTFRLILNQYFATDLDLLPDRSFYSTWDHPLRFFDVTEEVRSDDFEQPE